MCSYERFLVDDGKPWYRLGAGARSLIAAVAATAAGKFRLTPARAGGADPLPAQREPPHVSLLQRQEDRHGGISVTIVPTMATIT